MLALKHMSVLPVQNVALNLEVREFVLVAFRSLNRALASRVQELSWLFGSEYHCYMELPQNVVGAISIFPWLQVFTMLWHYSETWMYDVVVSLCFRKPEIGDENISVRVNDSLQVYNWTVVMQDRAVEYWKQSCGASWCCCSTYPDIAELVKGKVYAYHIYLSGHSLSVWTGSDQPSRKAIASQTRTLRVLVAPPALACVHLIGSTQPCNFIILRTRVGEARLAWSCHHGDKRRKTPKPR